MSSHKTSPARYDPNRWEAAYARFETPAQETRKFTRRLRRLGAGSWPSTAEIAELFCGRGNGLHALSQLGFTRIEGVDLSASLVALYQGSAKLYVGDCRNLPFETASKDIVITQGGLHHLERLPDDLERVLAEAARVLRENGLFVAIEPWQTPFLTAVHWICQNRSARLLVSKVDALGSMIDYERQTYEQWLGQPQIIMALLQRFFSTNSCSIQWGKCEYIGRKRSEPC